MSQWKVLDTANRAKRKREKMTQYKAERGCEFCEEKTPYCLEFHHVDRSTKLFEVSQVNSWNDWEDALAEIAKCVLLCANCHRKVHHGDLSLTVEQVLRGANPLEYLNTA